MKRNQEIGPRLFFSEGDLEAIEAGVGGVADVLEGAIDGRDRFVFKGGP